MNLQVPALLVLVVVVVCPVAFCASPTPGAPPAGGITIHLWPKAMLGPAADTPEKITVSPKGPHSITRITDVCDPTITVCKPPKAKDTHTAVIVCPGGGYSILAWDLEGTEIVKWLNSIGVTGVLLRYRVPNKRDLAFQDAQRAVSIVRSRAAEWKINPHRIGILGFSAGGHLAARTSTNFRHRSYKPIDDCDQASCRPDFAVLIYPAYLAARGGKDIDRATLPVSHDTPDTFVAIADGDGFSQGAILYFMALRKARVPAELHVYQFGGHGCGLRPTAQDVTTWPQACQRWMRDMKLLPHK